MGCSTKAEFKKTEMFAEYGNNCSAQYYRVTTEIMGKNAQVDYRSGWYDAVAVDALFGNISAEQTIEAATAKRKKTAIQKTLDNYMKALEDGEDATAIAKKKADYESALQGIQGTTTLGDPPSSVLDHADDKFVIILSSDPDKVIELIKGKVQSNNLKDTISYVLARKNSSQLTRAKIDLKILEKKAEQMKQAVETSESGIADDTTIGEVVSILEQLISQMEVSR
jgi:hypothetical protein